MTNSSKFFCNKDCEFFPCHKGVEEENFNCMFCYCPLYHLHNCPGTPEYLPNGIKDCSNCTLPHVGYSAIVDRLIKEMKKYEH